MRKAAGIDALQATKMGEAAQDTRLVDETPSVS